MQIGDDAVPQFVDAGALVPLDAYLNGKDPLDLGIYLPNLVKPGEYQGKQYMLPKDFSPLAVYYNKKPVSYTHLRAHETALDLVRRLLLEKKKYICKDSAHGLSAI